MENKLTRSHLDLIHKILHAGLDKKELAEVRAEVEKIKGSRKFAKTAPLPDNSANQ